MTSTPGTALAYDQRMQGQQFVDAYYASLTNRDLDAMAALYGDDAEIVRYDGVAATPDEIRGYHNAYLARNGSIRLEQVDQLREADDVLIFDALVHTDLGLLQAVHVIMFDSNGKVRRHIPGMRGFWGK